MPGSGPESWPSVFSKSSCGLPYLWKRAWQPTPVFLPGESHGQRSLVGYTVHRVIKNQTGLKRLSTHAHGLLILNVDSATPPLPSLLQRWPVPPFGFHIPACFRHLAEVCSLNWPLFPAQLHECIQGLKSAVLRASKPSVWTVLPATQKVQTVEKEPKKGSLSPCLLKLWC